MAQSLETATARAAEIYFELDRFQVADDEQRIELSGCWYGVRGRRFVRPTLTFTADGRPQRLLAEMEHKPWAAEDGADWMAAFPSKLDGEAVTDLELSVAPDIAVELPLPGAPPQRTDALKARPAHRARSDLDDQTARQIDAERRENERLRTELARSGQASVQAEAAIARRDAALSKVEKLTAERDDAVRARNEALQAQDAAAQARDLAVGRSEQLTRSVDALEAQLRETSAAAQRAESERRQTLLALEKAHVSAAARGALNVDPPVARRQLHWRRAPAGDREANWPSRLLALAVLLGALLAFALISHLL
jgi:hypothetical protein